MSNVPKYDPKEAAARFNRLPKNPVSTGRESSWASQSYREDQQAERDFLQWEAREQARSDARERRLNDDY